MHTDDAAWQLLDRDLRYALAVEVFVEFSFFVALLALLGVFNGGRPTTTPPLAVVYIVVGLVVTIAVIFRTRQMLGAARRRDIPALKRMNLRAWSIVALLFSAILPTFFLNDAAAVLDRHFRGR